MANEDVLLQHPILQTPQAQSILASLGKQAMSGDADGAKDNASRMLASVGLGDSATPSSFNMTAPQNMSTQPPATPAPKSLGIVPGGVNSIPIGMKPQKYSKATQTATQNNQQTKIERAPDELLDFSKNVYDQLPQVQEQAKGQNDLNDILNMQKAMAIQSAGQVNLQPMMALADAWSRDPKNLAASYTPPPTPLASMSALGNLADKVQNTRDNMVKNLTTAYQTMKTGQMRQGGNVTNVNVTGEGSPSGMGNMASARLLALPATAAQAIANDPTVKNTTSSKISLGRFTDILDKKDPKTGELIPLTPQLLFTGSNDISNSLAQGGYATDSKTAGEMVIPWAAHLADLGLKATDTVTDLRKTNPNLIAQIRAAAQGIDRTLSEQGKAAALKAAASYETTGNMFPPVKDSVNNKMKAINDFYDKPIGGFPEGPHGATVQQNGHTYNWNANTGKYE